MAPMRNNATGIAVARSTVNAAGQATSISPVSKSIFPLQRGSACLSCRKRKMKCDAGKPVCQQCVKGNRQGECEYDDGKSKSRTQMLQDKVNKLQDRVKELESRPPRQFSTTPPSPDPFTLHQQYTVSSHSNFTPSFPQPPQSLYPTSSQIPNYGYQTQDFQIPPSTTELYAQSSPSFHPSYVSHSRTSSHGSRSPGSGSAPEYGYTALQPQSQQYRSNDPLGGGPTNTSPLWDFHPPIPEETNWWENEDLTSHWRQTLLEIYLPHRHQSCFSVHVPSFMVAVQCSSIPPSAKPHPALMNAIYLLATHFAVPGSLPNVETLESVFLERALAYVGSALEHSDRLVNIVQASCLLACWFFGKGRLLEGYYHASSAGRLAIGLGLHQIRSDSFSNYGSGSGSGSGSPPRIKKTQEEGILPAPTSRMEIGERILTFWQVYNVDRCWAVATSLPSGLVDDDHPRTRILTVWPKDVEAYMDYCTPSLRANQTTPSPPSSSHGTPLGAVIPGGVANGDGGDSLMALRAKSSALFERASRLSTNYDTLSNPNDLSSSSSSSSSSVNSYPQQPQGTTGQAEAQSRRNSLGSNEKFWSDFRSMHFAITRFISALPTLQSNTTPTQANVMYSVDSRKPTLVLVHSLAHVAMIQLHHTFSSRDLGAHDKCLEAAVNVVSLISQLEEREYELLDPIIGMCWLCASDVLLREYTRRVQLPHRITSISVDPTSTHINATQLNLVNSQLDIIIGALSRLANVYPLATYQLGKVEQGRAEANAGTLTMSISANSTNMGSGSTTGIGVGSGTVMGAGVGF